MFKGRCARKVLLRAILKLYKQVVLSKISFKIKLNILLLITNRTILIYRGL